MPDAQGELHSRIFPGLRLPVAPLLAADTAKVLAALTGHEPLNRKPPATSINSEYVCTCTSLTGAGGRMTFPCMTTTVTAKGAVVLPQKVLKQHRVRAGDKFEITAAPDEPGVIELRRVGRKPNEGLVELLRSCPVKGFHIPKRSKELPRNFEL